MAKFLVMRQHIGDKDYFEGDVREANPSDVKHLVANGVLVADAPKSVKSEPPQLNKSETAPLNKAVNKSVSDNK